MRIAGFLLMMTGWITALAALVMLASLTMRTSFVLAGMGIEVLGLVLVARSHIPARSINRGA